MISSKKDGVELILEKQKQLKKIKLHKKRKRVLTITISIVTLIFIIYLYIASPISHLNHINITGINYFTRNEIMEQSGIEDKDFYLLTFTSLIKTKLVKNEMISEVIVAKDRDRNLNIKITEKRLLGYLYSDKPYLLIENGELIELTKEKQGIITQIPLIIDFNDEILGELTNALIDLSVDIVSNITEIHHYSSTYDENMLKIIMIDGNKVFTSLDSITTVNNYFAIVKSLKISNSCIFIDESSKTAYSSQCPESE